MEQAFRRELGALDEVFAFVERFIASERLGAATAFAAKLAVEELFTNLVRHNIGGRDRIEVGLELDGGRLVVRLEDFDVEPVEIDQNTRAGTDLPLDRRVIGGLGIHLVKSIFDALTYEYHGGTLRVTATKHLEDAHV